MDPLALAEAIRSGRNPNVPPDWWPQVREHLTAHEERAYWARNRH